MNARTTETRGRDPAPARAATAGPDGRGPASADELDRRYQALSDPKRRRILSLLREGERCVCELVDEMDVGQSLLSFHLKTLREAGLVKGRRDGRWIHYRARPGALAQIGAHLRRLAPGASPEPGD